MTEVLAVQGGAGVLGQHRRVGRADKQHELIGVELRRRRGLPDWLKRLQLVKVQVEMEGRVPVDEGTDRSRAVLHDLAAVPDQHVHQGARPVAERRAGGREPGGAPLHLVSEAGQAAGIVGVAGQLCLVDGGGIVVADVTARRHFFRGLRDQVVVPGHMRGDELGRPAVGRPGRSRPPARRQRTAHRPRPGCLMPCRFLWIASTHCTQDDTSRGRRCCGSGSGTAKSQSGRLCAVIGVLAW